MIGKHEPRKGIGLGCAPFLLAVLLMLCAGLYLGASNPDMPNLLNFLRSLVR